MDTITSMAGQLGIAAGFFLALILVLWWVGKHFDKERQDAKEDREQQCAASKLEREQQREEREQWQEKIDNMSEHAVRQLESNGNFQERVNEAHGFQREEHQKIVENLTELTASLKSMNGGTKVHA